MHTKPAYPVIPLCTQVELKVLSVHPQPTQKVFACSLGSAKELYTHIIQLHCNTHNK
jgi:hypothetical protein